MKSFCGCYTGPGKKKEFEKMKKNYKLQNTNYKGGGTPGLLGN
jgi:hypothetical protein